MMHSPNRMYVETYKTKPYIALDGVGQGVCSRTGFSNSVIFLIDNAIKPKIFKSSISMYTSTKRSLTIVNQTYATH